ncbi:MAG: response regulator [Bacteroidetes bacterium]|nr:response regulator [Bacteroidota bacterium]
MKKILLVEDNADIRENTAEILALANYNVVTAANGKEGFEIAVKENPDLIICDIMMPVLDGYGLLHLISKKEGLRGIPFIFLTAKSERGDLRKGMEMGADDYITKPFTEIEILNAIEGRLQKSEYIKENLEASRLDNFLNEVKNENNLEKFTSETSLSHFRKKQKIYVEGNHPHSLFYLNEGKVRTYKINDSGKELTINLFNSGDFFGYNALLEDKPYQETAETMEECDISLINREDFEILIHSNIEVAQKFIKLLAQNVSEKENQLLNLAYNSLRKRVAEAIITLLNKFKPSDESNFVIQMSREDLARIAGTTTESLIRTISDFKNEKLISSEGGTIQVINEDKLRSMLN